MRMDTGALNLAWAEHLLAALTLHGLRHVVLAPGARSAPLAVAALRRPELIAHVLHDERAAGFFALGIGKATAHPAAVITTSGTAAANLAPALVEAHLSQTPLLALTADRPPEAIGWGAHQTIEQRDLFADQLRARHLLPTPSREIPARYLSALAARLIREAAGPPAGPVHANVPFREPLLPETLPGVPGLPDAIPFPTPTPSIEDEALALLAEAIDGAPGLILCGEERFPAAFPAALARLSRRLAAPILAEALSGLRQGPAASAVCAHATRFLSREKLPDPAWVLRFGRFPLSRALERWLAGLPAATRIFQVAPPGAWSDPLWQVDRRIEAEPLVFVEALFARLRRPARAEFAAAWHAAEAQAAQEAARLVQSHFFEGTLGRLLIERLPAEARLFVGNSLPIRALDAFGGTREAPLAVFANRGAAGIDGNLATAAGIAAASGQPTWAFIGDQTLRHDATSLSLCRRHGVAVLVADNQGGGIFGHLPFATSLPEELFTRAFTAPEAFEIAALAAAFGLSHRRVSDAEGFAAALTGEAGARVIVAAIDARVSLAAFRS